MNFKQWLAEWEGFQFNQERDLVNGPQYPNSKYKGPSRNNEEGNNKDLNGEFDKIEKEFGFSKDDELLKLNRMKKKMRR
jgi:hypothetical protein